MLALFFLYINPSVQINYISYLLLRNKLPLKFSGLNKHLLSIEPCSSRVWEQLGREAVARVALWRQQLRFWLELWSPGQMELFPG